LPNHVPDDFLVEVQGLGQFPDVLDSRDADLARRLAEAFAQHPWVEQVQEVVLQSGGRIRVQLAFRVPVAIVTLHSRNTFTGNVAQTSEVESSHHYLIDRLGVHLPRGSETASLEKDLLRIGGIEQPPAGPPGTPWGLATVEAAAQAAAAVASERKNLALVSIDCGADPLQPDVRFLTREGNEIIWSSLQEDQSRTEAPTTEKLRRLRAYRGGQGARDQSGARYLLDLRPAEGMIRKQLPARPGESR
jgi:hypothetical protein